jgi:hypothetical protein
MHENNVIQGMFRSPWVASAVASVVICGTASTVSAIDYGDFAGLSVSYLGVEETSVTDTPPLFGSPSVIGNTLDFDPKGYGATSSGGAAPDLTDGQLNFGVQAADGYGITSLKFSEAGDFTVIGLGTADTYASVAAAFFVDVVEVDGVAIDPVQVTANMTFVPNASGKFELPTDEGVALIWKGSLSFDLNAALSDAGISYDLGATMLSVTLDNTLVAQSEAASTSFIAKKDFKVGAVTIVPEPTSLALALLGSLLLVPAMRRR